MIYKMTPFIVHIFPRESISREQFLKETPSNSIALDGYVRGAPYTDIHTMHINFNHHDEVVREATMSTAMQVYFAIKGGLIDALTVPSVGVSCNLYINDTDQDSSISVWILKNYKKFEGVQSIPSFSRLLALNDRWDITGGAFPMNLNDEVIGQHNWIFEPYNNLRKSGKLSTASAAMLQDNLEAIMSRLDQFIMGNAGSLPLDTRHEILYDSPKYKIIDEIGGSEARHYLFDKGLNAFVSKVATRPDGRFVYSVGKRSQFINFPVEELYDDLNLAEGLNRANGWNGSTIVGGSSRENGSSLSWQDIKEIVNKRIGSNLSLVR